MKKEIKKENLTIVAKKFFEYLDKYEVFGCELPENFGNGYKGIKQDFHLDRLLKAIKCFCRDNGISERSWNDLIYKMLD